MNCPVCQKNMTEQDFGGVMVDVCLDGCKSLWFDWMELKKLDETNEGFGAALQAATAYPRSNDAGRSPLICPKCGIKMHAHKYESAKEVNVDECYQCGGIFLDSGELKIIRDAHMNEQEERAYGDKLLANMPAYQEAEKDLEKQKLRADAMMRYTKYLRLSRWFTGK